MAHEHFNGSCEQSARNYHGAISRNFGSGRLDARLACRKKTIPTVRSFSGCLVPLAYDEDPEIETERAIIVRNGYKNAREVRAFVNESVIYAEQNKSTGQIAKKVLPDDVMKAAFTMRKCTSQKKIARATKTLNDFIFANPLISKKMRQAYAAGKINPVDVLRKSGLLGGRV